MIRIIYSKNEDTKDLAVGKKFIYYPFRHHQNLFVRRTYEKSGLLKENFYGLVFYDQGY